MFTNIPEFWADVNKNFDSAPTDLKNLSPAMYAFLVKDRGYDPIKAAEATAIA